jgi:hypothetical protein
MFLPDGAASPSWCLKFPVPAIDFLLPNPVTESDDSYWDGLDYRMSIADRLATDLATIARGGETDDGQLIGSGRGCAPSARVMIA